MEVLTLGFGAAMLMGLAFGSGPCTLTCIPYLGPVFLGATGGWRGRWRVILPFSLGRLTGYSSLGAVAGYAGYAASQWFSEGPAGIILGLMTMLLGVLLLYRAGKSKSCSKRKDVNTEQVVQYGGHGARGGMFLSLFGLGTGMALNPCLPLGTVLTAAAATADPWHGFALGGAFGLGAVLIPSLVLMFVVGQIGEQLRLALTQWRGRLEAGGGSLLILLGMATAMGWIQS